MNIHEYQGKGLFRDAGLPVLDGEHCKTVEEALTAYDKLGSKSFDDMFLGYTDYSVSYLYNQDYYFGGAK